MYELVKVITATKIEVLPQSWFWRKNAEQAARDLNSVAPDSGGLARIFSGPGPRWQAMHSKTASSLLKHAFMLAETRRLADEKPPTHHVVEDAV